MAREEYNLPLNQASYEHLLTKADGIVLTKQRFLIPLPGTSCTAELDIFSGHYKGLMLVEVEFETEEQANAFVPPEWFGKDVTFSGEYRTAGWPLFSVDKLHCGDSETFCRHSSYLQYKSY